MVLSSLKKKKKNFFFKVACCLAGFLHKGCNLTFIYQPKTDNHTGLTHTEFIHLALNNITFFSLTPTLPFFPCFLLWTGFKSACLLPFIWHTILWEQPGDMKDLYNYRYNLIIKEGRAELASKANWLHEREHGNACKVSVNHWMNESVDLGFPLNLGIISISSQCVPELSKILGIP